MTLLVLGLIVVTLLFLIKPHLLNNRKVVKKPFSRIKILLVGVLAIVFTLFSFGTVLAATEPASVKEARVAQEAARQKAEADAASAKQKEAAVKAPVIKTETKTEVIPFETAQQDSNTIARGQTKVLTEGADGERTIYYSVTYVEGKETARTETKRVVTKEPVTKVVANGTYVAPAAQASQPAASNTSSSCNSNYSGCVPNVSYDLNCPDIGYKVKVLGTDVYHLDGDHDGWGCESYGR